MSNKNNTYNTKDNLEINNNIYTYYSLKKLEGEFPEIKRLPYSLKILLENNLRNEDGLAFRREDIKKIIEKANGVTKEEEISYLPVRVLMQDFTGVPAVVDLAGMRSAASEMNKNPSIVNPLCDVDLVIDHSIMVDYFGSEDSKEKNIKLEFERNKERYEFLKWGQKSFNNFKVVPPGTGICHQVNLEYLATTVKSINNNGEEILCPDTCVGTDSHTTMVNALGVLGWGVGGIEAEAVMLGQPISMLIPEVVGFKVSGSLNEGVTATDLVLTVTNMLRKKNVVSKFVEFFGSGLDNLSLPDRATISNMAPEYGATCGVFAIDSVTLGYLRFTGRSDDQIKIVENYAKAQGLWRDDDIDPLYNDVLELDLSTVKPSIAGPKRPQDIVALDSADKSFIELAKTKNITEDNFADINDFGHGSIVLAAITSCTNTSNPSVLVAAGLVAKKCLDLGLKTKDWVKTSLAPGSKVVTDYLNKSGLTKYLDELGFNNVGYGCTSCIGNSGGLKDFVEEAVKSKDLIVNAVLSGNRNFEGRVNPHTLGNWLMSPPLVVLYAVIGNMKVNLAKDILGKDKNGKDIYLKDVWPSQKEIKDIVENNLSAEMFASRYSNVFDGDENWHDIPVSKSETYNWHDNSTYIKKPIYFDSLIKGEKENNNFAVSSAKVLLHLGDSITTDHISPAGVFHPKTPAGSYLSDLGVSAKDYNSYGSRRGNHEVMMRGTFANVRIKNKLVNGKEGGFTVLNGKEVSVYESAMYYKDNSVPLIVIGGKEYGTGSSRDWAAKGTKLLGVKAVVVQSFERIHRSNLVGMGVMPFVFDDINFAENLKLTGNEEISISTKENEIIPKAKYTMLIKFENGDVKETSLTSRIDTLVEAEFFKTDGILNYVLKGMVN